MRSLPSNLNSTLPSSLVVTASKLATLSNINDSLLAVAQTLNKIKSTLGSASFQAEVLSSMAVSTEISVRSHESSSILQSSTILNQTSQTFKVPYLQTLSPASTVLSSPVLTFTSALNLNQTTSSPVSVSLPIKPSPTSIPSSTMSLQSTIDFQNSVADMQNSSKEQQLSPSLSSAKEDLTLSSNASEVNILQSSFSLSPSLSIMKLTSSPIMMTRQTTFISLMVSSTKTSLTATNQLRSIVELTSPKTMQQLTSLQSFQSSGFGRKSSFITSQTIYSSIMLLPMQSKASIMTAPLISISAVQSSERRNSPTAISFYQISSPYVVTSSKIAPKQSHPLIAMSNSANSTLEPLIHEIEQPTMTPLSLWTMISSSRPVFSSYSSLNADALPSVESTRSLPLTFLASSVVASSQATNSFHFDPTATSLMQSIQETHSSLETFSHSKEVSMVISSSPVTIEVSLSKNVALSSSEKVLPNVTLSTDKDHYVSYTPSTFIGSKSTLKLSKISIKPTMSSKMTSIGVLPIFLSNMTSFLFATRSPLIHSTRISPSQSVRTLEVESSFSSQETAVSLSTLPSLVLLSSLSSLQASLSSVTQSTSVMSPSSAAAPVSTDATAIQAYSTTATMPISVSSLSSEPVLSSSLPQSVSVSISWSSAAFLSTHILSSSLGLSSGQQTFTMPSISSLIIQSLSVLSSPMPSSTEPSLTPKAKSISSFMSLTSSMPELPFQTKPLIYLSLTLSLMNMSESSPSQIPLSTLSALILLPISSASTMGSRSTPSLTPTFSHPISESKSEALLTSLHQLQSSKTTPTPLFTPSAPLLSSTNSRSFSSSSPQPERTLTIPATRSIPSTSASLFNAASAMVTTSTLSLPTQLSEAKITIHSSHLPISTSMSTTQESALSTSVASKTPVTSVETFEGTLITDETWKPNYALSYTTEYKNLKSKTEEQLYKAFSPIPGFVGVEVLRFFKGSTGIDFNVLIKSGSNVTADSIEQSIKSANSSGTLGFSVLRISVEKPTTKPSAEGNKEGLKDWEIVLIVACIVVALLIIIIIILVVYLCRLQKKSRKYDLWDSESLMYIKGQPHALNGSGNLVELTELNPHPGEYNDGQSGGKGSYSLSDVNESQVNPAFKNNEGLI